MILDWNADRASHAEAALAEQFYQAKLYDATGREVHYRVSRADLNSGWIEHIPAGQVGRYSVRLPAPLKIVNYATSLTIEGKGPDADGINSNYMPVGVLMEYINYKGEVEVREVMPQYVKYGTTDWHRRPQWLLQCTDIDKNEDRTFALSSIMHFDLLNKDAFDPHAHIIGAAPRSGRWKTVRAEHLKDNPACAVCGSKKLLNVHHIVPFHIDPDKELDRTNLITLCESPSMNHHLMLGHLGNWSSWNVDVVADAAAWLNKITGRPLW
jgi:5-methylcytosine-specific restriction protein A